MAKTAFHGSTVAMKYAASGALGGEIDHEKQAEQLLSVLGHLKGPVMKVAQFLATVPGALPKEYADAFINLQSHAPAMGEGFVKRRMKGELGNDWLHHFKDFNLTPSFAASLGQVHHATLLDDRKVACKLQYPDMGSIIEGDIAQLSLFLKGYRAFNTAIDITEIFEEIKEKLKEELDYRNEVKNQSLFRRVFDGSHDVIVPKTLPTLCTDRLITMEWVEGKSFFDMTQSSQDTRNHLSKILFDAWYRPLYHFGILHGDPHPGNYQANKDHGINLLDFGCVRIFPPEFIQGITDLYQALRDNNRPLLIHAYESWGFQHMSKEVIDVMSAWAKLLFEPLLDNRVRLIQEEIIGWDVASKVHAKLNKLGGIKPPKTFVFMDRAAVGIGSILFHMKAELNWHQMFEELIQNVSVEKLQIHQEKILNSSETGL